MTFFSCIFVVVMMRVVESTNENTIFIMLYHFLMQEQMFLQ